MRAATKADAEDITMNAPTTAPEYDMSGACDRDGCTTLECTGCEAPTPTRKFRRMTSEDLTAERLALITEMLRTYVGDDPTLKVYAGRVQAGGRLTNVEILKYVVNTERVAPTPSAAPAADGCDMNVAIRYTVRDLATTPVIDEKEMPIGLERWLALVAKHGSVNGNTVCFTANGRAYTVVNLEDAATV